MGTDWVGGGFGGADYTDGLAAHDFAELDRWDVRTDIFIKWLVEFDHQYRIGRGMIVLDGTLEKLGVVSRIERALFSYHSTTLS